MAGKFPVPAAPSVYTARYEHFKGCDFKSDQMSIDPCRFPYAQNLTLDTNGFPEKRPGFREVLSDLGGAVSSLFRGVVSDTVFLFIHAGNTVSARQIDGGTIASNPAASLENIQSCVFYAGVGCVYCMGRKTDENGFCFVFRKKDDGSFGFSDACKEGYVPKTSVAGRPLTTSDIVSYEKPSAGGASLEAVNLLGKRRENTFKIAEYTTKNEVIMNSSSGAFLLESPFLFYTDTPFSFPESVRNFLIEFYLRAFCVNGDDIYIPSEKNEEIEISQNKYNRPWMDFYGTAWIEQYKSWLSSCGGYVSINPASNGICFRRHAKALANFCSKRGMCVNCGCVYDSSIHTEDTFSIQFFIPERGGWVSIPMFTYVEKFTAEDDPQRLFLFWSVYDYDGIYSGVSNTIDRFLSDSFVRLYRLGHYYSKEYNRQDSFIPDVTAEENVQIIFSISDEAHQENLKKITGTRAAVPFGVNGAADRIFIAGVGEEKNYVRFCEMDNPLYWPDLNYVIAGNGNTGVSALFPIGSYLCIAKETNGQDVNLFLLEGTMQNGEAVFLIKEGVAGTGLIAPSAFAHVEDEPHFLAENGVFSLASSDITARKTVVNRSYFLDPRLTIELGKEKAVMVYWNFLLLLAFPDSGNVYVFNTRDKTYYEKAGSDHFVYEGWLWTSIPAVCFFKDGEHLYFGTQDGRLMKFNTDLEGTERFSDAGGKAIDAYFKTKAFDDGSFMTLKTMRKRGCGVVLKPFVRSSCEIYGITDQSERHLKDLSADIFNWEYIDFTRFEFSANPSIRIKPFNTKVKKYATIQFLVRNREVGESFGVIGIEKAYTMGNYKKN